MKKTIALFLFIVMAFCFSACGDEEMSYDEYVQFSNMEEELDQYHSFNDYNIIIEDDQTDFYNAVAEKYGEDIAEDVVDMLYTNSHPLGDHID